MQQKPFRKLAGIRPGESRSTAQPGLPALRPQQGFQPDGRHRGQEPAESRGTEGEVRSLRWSVARGAPGNHTGTRRRSGMVARPQHLGVFASDSGPRQREEQITPTVLVPAKRTSTNRSELHRTTCYYPLRF